MQGMEAEGVVSRWENERAVVAEVGDGTEGWTGAG